MDRFANIDREDVPLGTIGHLPDGSLLLGLAAPLYLDVDEPPALPHLIRQALKEVS